VELDASHEGFIVHKGTILAAQVLDDKTEPLGLNDGMVAAYALVDNLHVARGAAANGDRTRPERINKSRIVTFLDYQTRHLRFLLKLRTRAESKIKKKNWHERPQRRDRRIAPTQKFFTSLYSPW
jgi:hypothetical protein